MKAGKEPPKTISQGWKQLQKLAAETDKPIELLGHSLIADESARGWSIGFRILLDRSESPWIPLTTEWVLWISESYPFDKIFVFPSQKEGIRVTFPHQVRNDPPQEGQPWRQGHLCLETLEAHLGTPGAVRDPVGDVRKRMVWHLAQACRWVLAAAENRLVQPGEAFELPFFPTDLSNLRIFHDEGPDTYLAWQTDQDRVGHLELLPIVDDRILLVRSFSNESGKEIRRCSRPCSPIGDSLSGAWWRWPEPIVEPPWQAPATWGELRAIGKRLGVDVDKRLKWFVYRAKAEARLLLIGFAMPTKWEGALQEMFWKGIHLTGLPQFTQNRGRNTAVWEAYRLKHLGNDQQIPFAKTVNVHPDRLQGRGRWPELMRKKSVALIGAGSLGSSVAEILARGGISQWLLVDHDKVEEGNLVRHIAGLADCGKLKTEALRNRLQGISPWMHIQTHDDPLPSSEPELHQLLHRYDWVIDCSASDEVLRILRSKTWDDPKVFASFSTGWKARRLFAFFCRGYEFPIRIFNEDLRPWLLDEQDLYEGIDERFEGAGCWVPSFPARWAEVVATAAMAVRRLAEIHNELIGTPAQTFHQLEVWQQDEGQGLRLMESPQAP